jgi:hypothetical protein
MTSIHTFSNSPMVQKLLGKTQKLLVTAELRVPGTGYRAAMNLLKIGCIEGSFHCDWTMLTAYAITIRVKWVSSFPQAHRISKYVQGRSFGNCKIKIMRSKLTFLSFIIKYIFESMATFRSGINRCNFSRYRIKQTDLFVCLCPICSCL